MATDPTSNRAPLAEQTEPTDKRHLGRTDAAETPVEIRSLDGDRSDALNAWVHERLGRQLGKYAPHIERVEVRFGDENGPKGGIDRSCRIHVVLSALPPVVVEVRAGEDREAFDLAAGRTERALQRSMQKHGFNNKHKRRTRGEHGDANAELVARGVQEAAAIAASDEANREADAAEGDVTETDASGGAVEGAGATSQHQSEGGRCAVRARDGYRRAAES
jgi:putative sigma-54 modulation protein